jgi:hypothetical protein
MTYQISYYLGDMYHVYLMDANNEAEAITKALNRIQDRSKVILHDFKIERYYPEWN